MTPDNPSAREKAAQLFLGAVAVVVASLDNPVFGRASSQLFFQMLDSLLEEIPPRLRQDAQILRTVLASDVAKAKETEVFLRLMNENFGRERQLSTSLV